MPCVESLHHVTLTVTDLDRSVEWYQRVLGLERAADRQGDGWVRVLLRAPSGLLIGLTQHDATGADDRFDPTRVGLDHLSVRCADRAEVEAWARHLDEVGVGHGGIIDAPAGHLVVCRDPDDLPVELFASR